MKTYGAIVAELNAAGHRDLAKTLAGTRDEVKYRGDFITVLLRDGWYEFVHDMNGRMVAVLGFRRGGRELLGRYEVCPPHSDEPELCALTGGIEPGEAPEDAAVRELREESGIEVMRDELIGLGTIRPSKSTDSWGYLFGCDLTGEPDRPRYTGEGDGTKGERGSWCEWIDQESAVNAKDPVLVTMLARLPTRA